MIDEHDLEEILEQAASDLEALRGQRVLITGGTGFVGTWLVTALLHADARLDLRLRTTVLTRDPDSYAEREPLLAHWVDALRGDITAVPAIGTYDAVIHAATPASAALNDADPDRMHNTIVTGMTSLLGALRPSGAIPMLFTSSGAVYGPQPPGVDRLPETLTPRPDSANAYARGKLEAEALAADETAAGGPSLRLARMFAFVGPHLPLDAHFAIGNFIGDAIADRPIRVAGDGLAVRSYLYATDMVVALLAVLLRGQPNRPYNIGSENAVTIASLATTVRGVVAPEQDVLIGGAPIYRLPTGAGSRYVPDCSRIKTELSVCPHVSLEDAITRTAAWASK